MKKSLLKTTMLSLFIVSLSSHAQVMTAKLNVVKKNNPDCPVLNCEYALPTATYIVLDQTAVKYRTLPPSIYFTLVGSNTTMMSSFGIYDDIVGTEGSYYPAYDFNPAYFGTTSIKVTSVVVNGTTINLENENCSVPTQPQYSKQIMDEMTPALNKGPYPRMPAMRLTIKVTKDYKASCKAESDETLFPY